MLIDEGVKVVHKFPEWITDRDPENTEMVWNDQYKYFENIFLVCLNGVVKIAKFIRYPLVRDTCYGKPTSRKWYEGYWDFLGAAEPDGWLSLPEPIKVKG